MGSVSGDLFQKNIDSDLAEILKSHGAQAGNNSNQDIVEYPLACFGYLVGLSSKFRWIGV
jgi:hypothetical protein